MAKTQQPLIHGELEFPEPPAGRPYTLINMISTIDGKTLSGTREESVIDLGTPHDHRLMDRIEEAVDAVMIGANTIRATPSSWGPKSNIRIAISESGKLDYSHQFFHPPGGKAFVVCSEKAKFKVPKHVKKLACGKTTLDFNVLFWNLREQGIKRLLCLGGSELNAEILSRDLADELFLTIAPKVKLGSDVPTYAGGVPLPRFQMPTYELLSVENVEDEIFLRYRRRTP